MKRVIVSANGLFISKPGKDASSTNQDDFMVSPNFNLSSPLLTMSFSQATNQVDATPAGSNGYYYYQASVAHNLGYIPVGFAFGFDSNGFKVAYSADTTYAYVTGGPNSQQSGTITVDWLIVLTRIRLL